MFGVCMCEEEGTESKLLPKPPPPPPRRSSEGGWFPGKFISQFQSAAREKIEELPSLSTHGFSSHGYRSDLRRASAQEVALLFPNTTKAISKERELRSNANKKEWDQIEKWWISQLLAEAPDDEDQKNLLAKGKSPKLHPIPSDSKWAFEARIMHPACSGILRIILHFVTEFLSNDVVNVVSKGQLGQWTLPTLIQAFIRQIENILSEHPLWRAEFSNYTPSVDEGRPLSSSQEQQLRAQDAAWESSCDELENFIFRKIGAVLLPSKGIVDKHSHASSETSQNRGLGHGGTGSRSERSAVVYERLHSLQWITSIDLGVTWGGLDNPESWKPAAKELFELSSCQAPLEMIQCLVRCFSHVSEVLVHLLEESKTKAKHKDSLQKQSSSPIRHALLTVSSMNENQERLSVNLNEEARQSLVSRWSLESKDVGSTFTNLPCADDVLPAVILVLLQSNPRHILAYLDFALAFRNQQRLSSEAHYFIVTLTSAVHFLLDIEPDQLGLSEEEFKKRSRGAADDVEVEAACDEPHHAVADEMFKIEGIVEED